jgi:phosphatidylglycerophosphate synthase
MQKSGNDVEVLPSLQADYARLAVIDLRGEDRPRPDCGPLRVVCGLPLVLRTLLVLQRRGYDRALVLVHAADRSAVETALGSPRLRTTVQLVEDEGESLAPAAAALQGAESVLYWPGTLSFGRFAPPLVAERPAADGALQLSGLNVPLVQIGAEALRGHGAQSIASLLELLDAQGKLAPREAGSTDGPTALRPFLVRTRADARDAERALLWSLRKAADGAVAKFDRHVSLAISRYLMRLPVAPNAVTVVGGLLGVVCGIVASFGGYVPMLLGALGFQLNAILDGIDGEIARAKLFESRLGEWLDTIADDTSNLAFAVGVGIGSYHTWGSPHYLVLAAVAGAGFVVTAAMMYHHLITVVHSGDLNDYKWPWDEVTSAQGQPAETLHPAWRVLARLKWLLRRDAFVFMSTLCALAGQLRVMAWLFALGVTGVWIAIVVCRFVTPRLRAAERA